MGSKESQRTKAKSLLARWGSDPVAFSVEALGFTPWNRQADAMAAVANHDHVAVRSGHKVGKSRFDGALALWWICTRPRARVVFTATAGHQVENILWPELRDLYTKARVPIGGRLYDDYHKGLKLPDGREIFGLTTRDAEAFAGISSPGLLFIVDEASGFPEPIFDSVFGNMAGGGKVVLTGNPTRTSGTFYDAFHSKRAGWCTKHIRSLDTPNFHGGNIPGLANPAWAEWAKQHWGVGTPAWDVRAEGNFPRQGENVVVALHLIEEGQARWKDEQADAPLVLGVDPARFGDDPSAIFPRRGFRALEPTEKHGLDGPQLAAEVLKIVRQLRRDRSERPRVKVDVNGVGASCFDFLAREPEVEAIAVNTSEASTSDPEQYANLRAQLGFATAEWLKEGGALPPNERLAGELAAPCYVYDNRNRILIEKKDEIRKRLKRSPNLADALALAIYSPAVFQTSSLVDAMSAFLGR